MALESPAWVISASSHSAALFRQTAQTLLASSGIVASPGVGSLATTANGTPNMSVNVAAGMIWIPGSLGATAGFPSGFTSQGSYCGYNDGTVNLPIASADPTNPRIDIICASIQDAQYAGSNNQPVLQVVTGTAAPSPSVPAAPASTVILSQVAVAAGATSITSGNLTDRRVWVTPSGAEPLFSARQTTTATAMGSPAWTTVGFDTLDGDPYSGWNNSFSVWYVPFGGWWQTTVRVGFAFNVTGFRGAGIGYSATTPDPNAQVLLPAVPSSGNATTLEVTDTHYVAAGGYIRALGYQNSGGSLNTVTQCKVDIRLVHS